MLRAFWLSWLLYWSLLLVLPLQPIYPHAIEAFAIQFGFVALVSLGYGLVLLAGGEKPLPRASEHRLEHAASLAVVALCLSAVGAAFLYYDKTAIQGIDYSEGLASARQQWSRLGEERQGVSSIYSALGYAIGSSYYVVLVIAICQPQITRYKRVGLLGAAVGMALLNSYLTGGRSGLILFGAIALSATLARRGSNLLQMFPGTIDRIVVASLMAVVAAYALYVFQARAGANDLDAENYVANFLPFLGFDWVGWSGASYTSIDQVKALSILAAAYLSHSFTTVAAMVDDPGGGNVMLFGQIFAILGKLGISTPNPINEPFLPGRFPSLPGALWYNYGNSGLIFGSLVLGALGGVARHWTTKRPSNILPLGAFSMTGAVLALSPLLFAGDFIFFPFTVIAFVLLAVLSKTSVLTNFIFGRSSRPPRARAPVLQG